MGDLVGGCEFRCESCSFVPTPNRLMMDGGVCSRCNGQSWHLAIEYKRGTSAGNLIGDAAITAVGVGLLAAAGLAVLGGSGEEEYYHIDCRRLSASEVADLCTPPAEMTTKLGAVVSRHRETEAEHLREEMESKGATHCKVCNSFFVPSDEKHWTMLSFCSKRCCAESYGTTSYNRIEKQVLEATADLAPKLKAFREGVSHITVDCPCGNVFEMAKTYAGVYRKCPKCGMKVRVPLE